MKRLGIGVIGAHRWAEAAHLPGYAGCPRANVVAICDVEADRARRLARRFEVPRVYTDYRELLADSDVEMVDVCTPSDTHLALSTAALQAGKHVLCEKPLAERAADAFAAARLAAERGLRTKLGFTFRYSPAIRQVQEWVADGSLGEIFHVHGFEQNSEFLDPDSPFRYVASGTARDRLMPSSVVGYGAHLIDLMRWCAGDISAVTASMHNFIPERAVRGESGRRPLAIEDGTVALVEFESGAHGLFQTSYVAVGNYPGVEFRVYGSKGAAVARLVEERGIAETLAFASANDVEFDQVTLPVHAYPPGTDLHTPWPELYYHNLVRLFVDEILDGSPAECTFYDGAKSQEIVDAIVLAHRERRWVTLPRAPA